MAVRTTAAAVVAILGGNYDTKTSLTAFIATATALTDWVSSQDTTSLLNTTLLEQIECYLAAHFYTHHDKVLQSKSTGGASGQFQGRTDMGLASSDYGATAMMLDVSGALAKRNKEMIEGGKRTASVLWLGLAESEQTDYEDRD